MAFIFLPNKVLCPTLKHFFEVSLGTVLSNNSLIFLSSPRELVLLVSLFVFLLTYFSLFPVTWHTEAGTKCIVALTALLSSGKVRIGCPSVLGQDGQELQFFICTSEVVHFYQIPKSIQSPILVPPSKRKVKDTIF